MATINENNSSKMNITNDYFVNYEPVEKNAFAEFIREKRKEYNEDNGEELTTKDLGTMIGIKYEMFRKILNQEKPTKKRDCIIAICVALQLLPGEIDEALGLYQYMPGLDEENPRDNFIIKQTSGNYNFTVSDLNRVLIQRGFPGLDIQDKRDGKKKSKDINDGCSPYKVMELKVRTPVDSEYYYGDPYNSLCTKYSPSNCKCVGDMIIRDEKNNKYIHLIASTDGYLASQIIKEEAFKKTYDTLDETGNYKNYFIELLNTTKIEKHHLLCIINDTKNYYQRTSARLIGDSICVFTEMFNYSIPELNEYFVLTLSNKKYQLHVYEKSAFMQYYLLNDYKKTYGLDVIYPKETYDSLEQINQLINNADTQSEDVVKLKMRRNAFNSLKSQVDELYVKLKEEKEFIQNLDYIYDNPLETLRYYQIEDDFECKYDEVYGEISGSLDEKIYNSSDGSEIVITLNDVYKAFKYGFPNIEEICRIKATYGSIDSVLQ